MASLIRQYLQQLSSTFDPNIPLGFIAWGNATTDFLSSGESYFDLWIITPQHCSFKEAYELSQQEMNQRKLFSKKHHLEGFLMNRSSIFSQEECRIFLESFYWKYYMPLTQFNEGEVKNYDIPRIVLSPEQIQTDLITTLQERLERFAYNREEKLLRTNLRDYGYFCGTKKSSLFQFSNSTAQKNISSYIEVYARQPQIKLAWQRQNHALLSTLQTIRWELFNSHEDSDYFEKWKRGTHEGDGYSLPGLGNFLFQLVLSKQCDVSLEVKELGRLLTQLLHEKNTDLIPTIYPLLSKVLLPQITQPSLADPTNRTYSVTLPIAGRDGVSVCKVSHDKKYIISEYEGQQRYAPSSPEEVSIGNISYIISPFIEGKKYNQKDMHILAALLRKIHQTKGTFFGRIGSGPHFPTYDAFIYDRIEHLPESFSFKKILCKMQTLLREELKAVVPVACHMDPNPGNVLIHPSQSTLIDWEHFSYCAKEWDVERALLESSENGQEIFRSLYYTDVAYNPLLSKFTRIVAVAGYAANQVVGSEKHKRLLLSCYTLLNDLQTTLSEKVSTKANTDTARPDKKEHRPVHRRANRKRVASTFRKKSHHF